MQDYFTLGPAPSDEDCAQVGEDDYRNRALPECKRYIALLRKTFGPEPEGAHLAPKWFPHDFGDYVEVVCYFDPGISKAVKYAQRCENEAPTTWEG